MRIAVMQPYLFPYVGDFQLIRSVDKFILFDDVNYINKGWINRNRILVNNAPYLFTVPLAGASQNKLINETEVEGNEKWRVKFLRTVEMSYSKAPYFKEVFPLIKEIIYNSDTNLSHFVHFSIVSLADYAGISTRIIPTSQIYKNELLKGEDRIIDICLQESAGEYVNPIGGLELYSKEKFEQKGIKLLFVKTNEVTYKQNSNTFVPWLSIIDILMFCDKEQVNALLGKYELI